MSQRVTKVGRMSTYVEREARMLGDPEAVIVVDEKDVAVGASSVQALAMQLSTQMEVAIPTAGASAEAMMVTVGTTKMVPGATATAASSALTIDRLPGLGLWLMIDVTNPPSGYAAAVGDGSTDDQIAIQAMIDGGLTGLYFPNTSNSQPTCVGRYKIMDTITLPHRTGFHFLGEGGFLADQISANSGSIIEWGDTSDYTKPMIIINGTFGMWNGVSLRGNQAKVRPDSPGVRSPDASKAAAGIHLEKDNLIPGVSNFGTGKIYFQFLYMEDLVAGFRTGGTVNADVCRFDFTVMRDVTRMWHFAHSQALSWTMGQIHELECPIIFQCDEGCGRIVHDNLHLHGLSGNQYDTDNSAPFDGQTVLRIGAGGVGVSGGTGSVFHFNNIVDDDGSKKWLIDQTSASGDNGDLRCFFTNCDFKNVTLANGNHINVRVHRDHGSGAGGRSMLVFKDCTMLHHLKDNLIFTGGRTRDSLLRIDNCQMDGETSLEGLFSSTSSDVGYIRWKGRDNYRWDGDIADETGSKGTPV